MQTEQATVEWSSPEIAALLAADRAASREPKRRVRMPCNDATLMLAAPPVPVPVPVPDRTLAIVARRTPRTTTITRRPIARTRDRWRERAVLASLAMIGFAVGTGMVAALCAFAHRPWF